MDFDLSEEQRMLRESVERLIAERYDFEQRKQYMKEPSGFSKAMWAQYAEMGLLGLPFDERYGGSGGGAVEAWPMGIVQVTDWNAVHVGPVQNVSPLIR